MLELYEKYLELIDNILLKKYFNQQKHYLHCKEGCSHCCKSGQYPFTELEFKYFMLGYNNLKEEYKDIIQERIKKIKQDQEKSTDEVFMYECPFLINECCCLYKYRAIICRTYGLLYFITAKDGSTKNLIPSCMNLGLNYSNVYDKEQKFISEELWEKSGIEEEPVAYNISHKALINNSATEELGLEFGELKALIDWF